MNILHVLYSGLGGHSNVLFSMVEADMEKEFRYQALFNGVEQIRQEYIARCKGNEIKWAYLHKKKGLDLNYLFQLYKQIKGSKADIIFLHGGNAVISARLAKFFSRNIKRIVVRETQANHLKGVADWIRLSLALIFADKIIFLTPEYKDQVAAKLKWIFREKKTTVIPNGINTAVFQSVPRLPGPVIQLGMQSRLVKIKDHKTVLNAMALLLSKPDYKGRLQFTIAGDGQTKTELMQLVGYLGIEANVFFTGTLDETELVAYLNNLDIYVHASLGETMSTSIMQAMACGKPVIASDVPGINNMLEDRETGLLIPPEDVNALADAISVLVNDPALAGKIASQGARFAISHYSNALMFSRYRLIFNS